MNRTDFFNELIPDNLTVTNETLSPSGTDSRKVYKNKPKDVNFIKKIVREKVNLDGAPIKYFPIDTESNEVNNMDFDNSLKDHTHLELNEPIDMMATWTPQEYQMDLSKFGLIMPSGSDQQIFIHVDEISEKLNRKPLIGDIIETEVDRTRYKIADVFFGHNNLWENIFCMVTLTKVTYDNYTSQLDAYDEEYKDTYTSLESVLDIMSGEEEHKSNNDIIKEKEKTESAIPKKPKKRSLDTVDSNLDIMTMKL